MRRALLKGAGSIGVALLAPVRGGATSAAAAAAASAGASSTATAALNASDSSAPAGSSVTFTLRTTGVAAGTPVDYMISGVGATDIAGNDLEGRFVVGPDGCACVTVPIAADNLADGPGAMHMTVAGGFADAAVLVDNSGVTPLPTYTFSSSADTTSRSVDFRLQTSAVPTGTELAYTLDGVAAADTVDGKLAGRITIDAAGVGTAHVALAASARESGAGFLRITLDDAPATFVAQLPERSARNAPAAPASPRPLSTLAPNTARNLGLWIETGAERDPDDAPAQRTDYSCVAYDPVGKRILMRGGHHGRNVSTNIRALDLRTLQLSNLFPSTAKREMTLANCDSDLGRWISTNHPWSRHTYNGNVVLDGKLWMMAMQNSHQPMNGMTFPPGFGRSAAYDLSATDHRRGWSYSQIKGNWFMMIAACAARDKILVVIRLTTGWAEAWLYDPESDTRLKLPVSFGTTGWVGDPCVVAYPPNGRYYAFMEDGKVWEIALDVAKPSAATSVQVASGWPPQTQTARGSGYRLVRMDYDPVNRVIGGSLVAGSYVAFDPVGRTWKQFTAIVEAGSQGVPTTAFWCGAFDQESGCYIAFAADGNHWAYKPPPFDVKTPAAGPTTMLQGTPNPAPAGSAVTFTAIVAGAHAPAGTVTFEEGALVLGTAALVNGSASFTHSGLAVGTHGVTATYVGDATTGKKASESAVLEQVITGGGPGRLSVELDFGDGRVARFSGGVDIGAFHGEFVHQRCLLATDPVFPDWRVMFRPDVDGRRDEVIIEYGRAVGGTPANRLTPYTARILSDGAEIYTAAVPTHWWDARWRWQSAPRPVVRTPAELVARGWIPPLGTEGLFGRAPYTYAGVWDGPMTIPAHVSTGMGAAGDNPLIGPLTEAAAEYVIRGTAAHLQTIRVEGEQCGTWGMHTRFADGSMPDVRGQDLYYKGAKAGATINEPPRLAHPEYMALAYSHWFPCANMAWLLTDDPFMLEELQFGVNWRLFWSSWTRINVGLGGLIDPSQVRSTAWALRDQFLLACSTPSSTPKWLRPRSTWKAQVDDTRSYMLRYVNSNTRVCKLFRVWFRYDMVASWMGAFLNLVLGLAVKQGFAEWRPLFDWGLGQHIAMSDGKSGWDVQLATPYYWWPLRVEGFRPAKWPVADDAALDAATHESWRAACDAYAARKLPGVDRSTWDGQTPKLTGIEAYILHLRAVLAMGVRLGVPEARPCLERIDRQIRLERWNGQARFAVEP